MLGTRVADARILRGWQPVRTPAAGNRVEGPLFQKGQRMDSRASYGFLPYAMALIVAAYFSMLLLVTFWTR